MVSERLQTIEFDNHILNMFRFTYASALDQLTFSKSEGYLRYYTFQQNEIGIWVLNYVADHSYTSRLILSF